MINGGVIQKLMVSLVIGRSGQGWQTPDATGKADRLLKLAPQR